MVSPQRVRDDLREKSALALRHFAATMHGDNQPLEILRTIHGFDPCIACAVHVLEL